MHVHVPVGVATPVIVAVHVHANAPVGVIAPEPTDDRVVRVHGSVPGHVHGNETATITGEITLT